MKYQIIVTYSFKSKESNYQEKRIAVLSTLQDLGFYSMISDEEDVDESTVYIRLNKSIGTTWDGSNDFYKQHIEKISSEIIKRLRAYNSSDSDKVSIFYPCLGRVNNQIDRSTITRHKVI